MCKRTEITQGKKKKDIYSTKYYQKVSICSFEKKKSLSYEFPIYILEKNEGGDIGFMSSVGSLLLRIDIV